MNRYAFALRFRLPYPDAEPEHYVEALNESGCRDALIGLGRRGEVLLEFSREAASVGDAIATAVQAVRFAIPEGELVETVMHGG